MNRTTLALAPLALSLLAASAALAQDNLFPQYLERLTTVPEDDFSPALSPDGRWVVFVSAATGQGDLVALDLNDPLRFTRENLFAHPTRDESPVFSPDGSVIAWTSWRSDVYGDVWAARYPYGEPINLGKRVQQEQVVGWQKSNDQLEVQLQVASSTIPSSIETLNITNLLNLKRDNTELPTTSALALKYFDDTNNDGILGDVKNDWPTLWEVQGDELVRQITPPLPGLTQYSTAKNEIVFSLLLNENRDVYRLKEAFPLDEESLLASAKLFENSKNPPLRDLYLFTGQVRNAITQNPASPLTQQSFFMLLKSLRDRNLSSQALEEIQRFREALNQEDEGKIAPQLARWEAALNTDRAARMINQEQKSQLLATALDQLDQVLANQEFTENNGEEFLLRRERALVLHAMNQRQDSLALQQQLLSELQQPSLIRSQVLLDSIPVLLEADKEQGISRFLLLLNEPQANLPKQRFDLLNQLYDAVNSDQLSPEDKLEQLRVFRSKQVSPYLLQHSYLREASLLADLGQIQRAEQSLESIQFRPELETDYQAELQLAAANIERSIGNYKSALQRYQKILASVPLEEWEDNRDAYEQTRDGYLRESLSEANTSLRLSDNRLAYSQFKAITEIVPESVEAWRGFVEAENRTNLLTKERLSEYRKLSKKPDPNGLAAYRYGLALSYPKPDSKEPKRLIERAITANSSVPYYYQTLGFLAESRGRKNTNSQEYITALSNYQRALGLVNLEERPTDYARLLQNAGNMAFAIDNTARALDYYRERESLGIPFDDSRASFLFNRNYGVTAFRSYDQGLAISQFQKASEQLSLMERQNLVTPEQAETLALELVDREALAEMSRQNFTRASVLYESVVAKSEPNTLSQARALRNQGYAFFQQARGTRTLERYAIAEQAITTLNKALEVLKRKDLVVPREASGGLFSMSLQLSSNDQSKAQLNLSPADERRFVSLILSRLKAEFESPQVARESLEAQLKVLQETRITTAPQDSLAILQTLDELATLERRTGNTAQAFEHLIDGFQNSNYGTKANTIILLDPTYHFLIRLSEVGLSMSEDELANLKVNLFNDPVPVPQFLEQLDKALSQFIDSTPFQSALIDGSYNNEHVSLLLQRALIAERLSLTTNQWLATSYAAQASMLVNRSLELGSLPTASAREKRWMVLAYGLKVRLANRFQFEQEATVAEAELFYNQQGYDDWLWWLTLQQLITTSNPEQRFALQRQFVDQLDSTTATSDRSAFLNAKEVVISTVADYMKSCAEQKNYDELIRAGEVLRHAEFRLQYAPLDWLSSSATPQEQEWFSDWKQYRRQVLQTRLALQSRNVQSSFTQQRSDRLLNAKELLANHLQTGVNSAFPSALRFSPFQLSGDAAAVLRDFILSNQSPHYIVSLPGQFVLFSGEGEPQLFTSEAELISAIPENALVFTSDYRPTGTAPLQIAGALRSPSLSLTMLALSQSPLRLATDVAVWNADSTREQLEQTLAKADLVNVEAPLDVQDQTYTFWRLGDRPLETQLALLEETREWNFADVAGDPLPFVALLATANTAQITTKSGVWLAELLNPEEVPDLAASELDAELARVISLLNQGRTREAVGPLRRVYLLRRALQLPLADQVEAGRLLAQVYRDLGQAKDALPLHEEILASLVGDDHAAERATQLKLYASDANEVRNWEVAATAYKEASDLYSAFGEQEEAMLMLRRAAVVRENQGELNQSLAIIETLLADSSLTDSLRYQLHSDRGRIYLRRLNRYEKALVEYQEAERLAALLQDRDAELLSALDVVRVKEKLGMISEATDSAKAILELTVAEGLESRECDALLTLSFLEWTKGQYLNAFNYQERGQQLANRLSDQTFQLIALNYRGLIYWSLNDLGKSLAAYTEAMDFAERQFFELDLSSTLNNRSLVFRTAAEYDKALADLNRAFEIDGRWNNSWALAYNLRNRGLTYLESGNAALAEEDFRKALTLTQTIGDTVNEAKVHLALARSLTELDRLSEAEPFFKMAIERADSVPLPEVKWRALYGLSECAKKQQNPKLQDEYLVQAIAIVDNLRASLKLAEFQDGFLLDKQVLYDDLVLLRMDQGDWAGAYAVSEQARGRNFIDLLGNQKVDFFEGADEEDLRREELLRSRMEILERQLGSDDATLLAVVTQQLDAARKEYADFILSLRARNPELTEFISVESIGVKDIQALLDPETAVVQYHVTENELVAFLIGQQTIRAVRVPLLRSTLREQILSLRERLQTASDLDTLQTTLSASLIQPFAADLAQYKRLAIVPHRELHLMPFAVLKLNDQLLLESHALYFSPSGSVLRYTMSKKRSDSNKVLALGNPKLSSESFNLPMAEKEARRIVWSFPEATVLTGAEATKTWLVENIANYGIVHLAMHGEFKPEAPMLSGLQLAPDAANNGVLTAADIFGLSMNADMVALSACQTGLGRITEGDEVIGLNRSFVYAGTRQVLSSLWRVDDVSTSILIKHFYRNMGDMDRAEALRQAQLNTRQQYPHPTYWAGITLSGDWE